MGFMDKAKKMAEQAQSKLDEAQKQFNQSGTGQQAGGGPAVEYDKHGRPVQPAPVTPDAAAPPAATPGVPPTDTPGTPAQTGPAPDPSAPPPPAPDAPATPPAPAAPSPPPAASGPTPDPGAPEDRNRPSTEPPKMSHGDPLAG